tara:strand:+ start:85 stop:627 length:543 start_codon:yes stop_codon:yes gene_type:complete
MRPKAYVITSAYAVSIFSGDPVKLTSDGVIQLGTSDGTRSGTTDGVTLLGILAGVEYLDATGKPTISPFWPGGTTGTNITAWVYDDPETLFDVQYANPGTPGTDSVQTAVGAQCDFRVASPGGSTSTGISSTYLTATVATSGQFQITGFAFLVTDSLTDAYVNVTVRLNEAAYKYPVNAI